MNKPCDSFIPIQATSEAQKAVGVSEFCQTCGFHVKWHGFDLPVPSRPTYMWTANGLTQLTF